MAKKGNASKGVPFGITISRQSIALLEMLAKRGIYGRNAHEVAGRLVDRALEDFTERPRFTFRNGEPLEKESSSGGSSG